MKATIDIPDQLYRRVKARAALEGRTVRDISIDLFGQWLSEVEAETAPAGGAIDDWLARWAELGDRVLAASVDDRLTSEIIAAERR